MLASFRLYRKFFNKEWITPTTGCGIAVVLMACSTAAAAQAQGASVSDYSSAGWLFVHIGEGFTSRDAQQGIDVGYRMFSAPTFGNTCERAPQPARLEVLKLPIELRVDDWFQFNRIVVVARDAENRPLGPVPITLEVEEQDPPLLNLRSDMIADGGVWPLAVGRLLFRARTICPRPSLAVVMPARVDKN